MIWLIDSSHRPRRLGLRLFVSASTASGHRLLQPWTGDLGSRIGPVFAGDVWEVRYLDISRLTLLPGWIRLLRCLGARVSICLVLVFARQFFFAGPR